MLDFRKLLLAFAAITLLSGIASAQSTAIICGASAQPLTVRAEGLTEQTGDVVIRCVGGTQPTIGSVLPQVNISLTLSPSNITSRLLSGDITEALLFVDDPQPGTQSPCAPSSGVTLCQPLFAGAGGTAVDSNGVVRNVFQARRQTDNTVVWLGVPINAPGSTGERLFRMKNVRAQVAGASAANGQIFGFVSIQNPPANLQLTNSTVNVAFVQQGLTFGLRSATGGGFSSGATGVFLFQCESWNSSLAGSPTASYNQGRSFVARFTEGYAASWKVRDVNPPLTEPGLQQNIPQANNGTTSNQATVVESGFYNTTFTATNGLNRAGRADHGTRLRIAFNNVPANVRIYVSSTAVSGTSSTTSAHGVATDATGTNVAAGTVLANPLSSSENTFGGNASGYPTGAKAGLIEVPLVGGSGSYTWEVFAQDPGSVENADFAVALAYRSTNNPGLGTMTVNGSFAPLSTANTMSSTAPIPRFADQSTAINAASINVCQTNLLFPFVSNDGGFDTGIAIANTSSDPFGTAPQSGNCELNYYGGTTGGGAAPSKQTTTSAVASGKTLLLTLSSGGTNGIAATPGFTGYIIAICNFRYAHGFAFISDVGAQKLAQGYLALILDSPAASRTNIASESLGQ